MQTAGGQLARRPRQPPGRGRGISRCSACRRTTPAAVAQAAAVAAARYEVVGQRDLRPVFAAAIGDPETVCLILTPRSLTEARFLLLPQPSDHIGWWAVRTAAAQVSGRQSWPSIGSRDDCGS